MISSRWRTYPTRRPLVGINGEVYIRSNRFSNRDLVRVCEEAGLEVVVSPLGEWGRYVVHRHLEDVLRERKLISDHRLLIGTSCSG